MDTHSAEDAVTPLVGVPASQRPRRSNQRPSGHAGRNSGAGSSAPRPVASMHSSGLLLEMPSSAIDESVTLDLVELTGPMVLVARAPTRASSVGIPTDVSLTVADSASVPRAQTTQVSKDGLTLARAQTGTSPGAYQIQGRAVVGARPGWVRCVVGNNIRGSMSGGSLMR
jgi:hypothetical protein